MGESEGMRHVRERMGRDAPADGADAAAIAAAIAGLPDYARGLAAAPGIAIVPHGDDAVPADLAGRIAKAGRTASVTMLRGDGDVLVVIGDPGALRHEMIHVAQVHAGGAAMAAALAATAADGGRLEAAVAARGGERRDLDWCAAAAREAASRRGAGGDPFMSAWEIHRMVHPIRETAETGAAIGLGRDATGAAAFAAAAARAGGIDPGGDAAREIVAYRHQHDLAPLAALFADATARREAGFRVAKDPGSRDVAGARAVVDGLFGRTGDVVLLATRREVDEGMMAPRNAGPMGLALKALSHAVRQPLYDASGAATGETARGRTGLHLLHETFGPPDRRRGVRFGREALIERLADPRDGSREALRHAFRIDRERRREEARARTGAKVRDGMGMG